MNNLFGFIFLAVGLVIVMGIGNPELSTFGIALQGFIGCILMYIGNLFSYAAYVNKCIKNRKGVSHANINIS